MYLFNTRGASAQNHAQRQRQSTRARPRRDGGAAFQRDGRGRPPELPPLDTLSSSYAAVEALAAMLARWSVDRRRLGLPAYAIGTGGGPGIMEAANEGALAGGGRSAGFGISLPFEASLNRYVEPELAFTFHYFMTRKMTMAYRMSALVVAPAGFGTCDELFEILTLKLTGKIKRDIPVVLLDAGFWRTVINWQAFVASGVVAEQDVASLIFVDSSEAAFEAVVAGITELERKGHVGAHRSLAPKDSVA